MAGAAAGLTPAERAEYDLHFSTTAVALRERMSQINASEQEFRAIMAVVPALVLVLKPSDDAILRIWSPVGKAVAVLYDTAIGAIAEPLNSALPAVQWTASRQSSIAAGNGCSGASR